MWILRIDDDVCVECDECGRILGGFRTDHKGKLMISNTNYKREEIKRSCRDVMQVCPQNAIYLDRS